MRLFDYLAGKAGYVRRETLQAAEGRLHAAVQDNDSLMLEISGLEGVIEAARRDYDALSEQTAYYRTSAEQAGLWQLNLARMLELRGADVGQLFSYELRQYSPNELDTSHKLQTVLGQMPEIRVVYARDLRIQNGSRVNTAAAYFAVNVLNCKAVQIPEGRIRGNFQVVVDIFTALGIEDRLQIPQNSHVLRNEP